MRDTLIIGLGHPLLSDDALGLHALTMLTGRPIPAVEYLVGGQDLLSWFEYLLYRPRIIILDAVDEGYLPGTVIRRARSGSQLVKALAADELHSHSTNLNLALALMQLRRLPLPTVVIYGIQPASVMPGEGLSPVVARAMHFLVERILADEPWHPEKYLSDATWAIPHGVHH